MPCVVQQLFLLVYIMSLLDYFELFGLIHVRKADLYQIKWNSMRARKPMTTRKSMTARDSMTARKPMKARKSTITRLIQVIDAPDIGSTTSFHIRVTVPLFYHILVQIQHSSILFYISHVERRHESCPTIFRLRDRAALQVPGSPLPFTLEVPFSHGTWHLIWLLAHPISPLLHFLLCCFGVNLEPLAMLSEFLLSSRSA